MISTKMASAMCSDSVRPCCGNIRRMNSFNCTPSSGFSAASWKMCAWGDPNQSNIVDVLLTMGPDGVKRAWDERAYVSLADEIDLDWDEDLDYPLFAGYFSLPLENIWTVRKVTPPKDDEPGTRFILDTIIGANDLCSQCAAPGGLALLTEANWHRAPLYPGQLLKGKLNQTPTFQTFFFAALRSHARPDHRDGGSACSDSDSDDDEYPLAEDESFSRQPWVARVFGVAAALNAPGVGREHLWRWLLQERINGGWSPPPQNCWYGYNCRTMVHNQTHANKLNHLCVPTRGEA
ncbi:F-box domain-containing protein [Mycena sanguinolenta]|uniref:F-box domain-containing protein n=1 Tax=Mycena sanguinolenta TaxID=230812 RepID=A0A8H6Y817_9AGAR|nr:F-box domain-containing protein [Mycena sanguinolenta]